MYKNILESLVEKPMVATEINILSLMPHIPKNTKVILRDFSKKMIHIAIPAVKIMNSVNIICIDKGKIFYKGNRRIFGSLIVPSHVFPIISDQILFIVEANQFSSKYWASELIADTWPDDAVVVYSLGDPTKGLKKYTGGCRFIKNIYAVYDGGLIKSVQNNSRDKDLIFSSESVLISFELMSNRKILNFWICCHCWSGLTHTECFGCKKKYPPDIIINQEDWALPLHESLINIIKNKSKK